MIRHVRNDRRADPDTDRGGEEPDVGERRPGLGNADRKGQHRRDSHGKGQGVDRAKPGLPGGTVPENHIAGEQHCVQHGADQPDAITGKSYVGQHVNPADCQHHRECVTRRSDRERGQNYDRHELDGGDGAERYAVDGEIEAAVHRGEHDRPPGHESPDVTAQRPPDGPSYPPQPEHRRGRSDPQPRNTEWFDPREQQYRDRRTQVVEDRTDDEVRLCRNDIRAVHRRLHRSKL